MMKLTAFAAVAMTVLAGCMLGPDYQRPTLPLPAQYRDAEPPAPGREAVSLADLQWFQLFQDDALQALIRTALQQNYDVRIAVARILEAQAQLGITRSFLFPQLDGNGTIARDRISEERFLTAPSGQNEGNTFFLGLSLFYEIDLWGRLRRETEAARAELLVHRVGPAGRPGDAWWRTSPAPTSSCASWTSIWRSPSAPSPRVRNPCD